MGEHSPHQGKGEEGMMLKEESGKTHKLVQERSGWVWLGLREKVRNRRSCWRGAQET